MKEASIIQGDALAVLADMLDASVDSIVTDPPYGLKFMGKKWDCKVPSVDIWREALRVLKPGGHLLAFAGTRTQHRMACNIEDAGFQIRDMIAWVYGSGLPKSRDISKAIDKEAGAEREVLSTEIRYNEPSGIVGAGRGAASASRTLIERKITAPATPAARQWNGWGTALKPALEPITVARKPIAEATIAANVLEHGTGAINIDGCRVETTEITGWGGSPSNGYSGGLDSAEDPRPVQGRFPANLIHDGSEEVLALFPESIARPVKQINIGKSGGKGQSIFMPGSCVASGYQDSESTTARFFYCGKASKDDRDAGLERMEGLARPTMGSGIGGQPDQQVKNNKNAHPTVKPTDLMRYLCRLVTPPGGLVLDPFAGSGSTGKACVLEGFRFVGVELDPEWCEIARARIAQAQVQPDFVNEVLNG